MRRLGGPTTLPNVLPCTCFIFIAAHHIHWTAQRQYVPCAAPSCCDLPFLCSCKSAGSLCLFYQLYSTSLLLLLLTEKFFPWPPPTSFWWFPPTIFSLLIN